MPGIATNSTGAQRATPKRRSIHNPHSRYTRSPMSTCRASVPAVESPAYTRLTLYGVNDS